MFYEMSFNANFGGLFKSLSPCKTVISLRMLIVGTVNEISLSILFVEQPYGNVQLGVGQEDDL